MARRKLKTGFSTGTAATTAAKAALIALLTGHNKSEIEISLPTGGELTVPVEDVRIISDHEAEATVIKDGGDDPDATHRAAISAKVTLPENQDNEETIIIEGGEGVGRVTRPGLPIPVGEPAINPVPRQMIQESLRQAWNANGRRNSPPCVRVAISVRDGEQIARRTLNPRLGIVGGISILGTTGLVKPFSHEAYTATIESAVNVAKEMGIKVVVLTTGGRSEKRAMSLRPDLPEAAFIQIADYFGFALKQIRQSGLAEVGLVSFFGKAVKQAKGLVYTHAHKAPMDLARLASWLKEDGAGEDLAAQVTGANTARQALDIMKNEEALDRIGVVGTRMLSSARGFLGPKANLWGIIIDYDGTVLYEDRNPGRTG